MSHYTIAEKIIEKCGGAQAIADALHIQPSMVHKWKYSKERQGQDGLIPAKYQHPIMEFAKSKGIDLRPEDFFEVEEA